MMTYGEPFLRSVNLQFDAEEPHRIAHYVPTTKCAPLISSLLGREEERAFFIIAPYGSGKSLTALYLLHLIEKQAGSEDYLKRIEQKLREVNPELSKFARGRRYGQKNGLTITLHGYVPSLPQAIKDGVIDSLKRVRLGREAASKEILEAPCSTIKEVGQFLTTIKNKFSRKGIDRIAILWDEFGKHLESLLLEGRPTELLEIQSLAEIVSRFRNMPITLGLFLHQGLLHYAGNMSQSVRAEWTKIEGRFQSIQYVDDSKEIYRLIADVITTRKGNEYRGCEKSHFINATEVARNLGIFSEFKSDELEKLFEASYPLNPVTLYLLPRISARVAQNERTLFNFIYSCSFDEEVSPWHLFDYFAPQMRSDIAVGGTYRQWLETQSAISKVGNDSDSAFALKSACLLGLGFAGDRSRTGKNLLLFSLKGYCSELDSESIVQGLIDKKLLLYRKYNDEISVWHGTDMDLRGRLEEEKQKKRNQFGLLDFLDKEARPSPWRPNEYNSVFGVRRYFTSEYHTLKTIKRYQNISVEDDLIPPNFDGKVLYLLADNPQDLSECREYIEKYEWDLRFVIAVPREPVPLFEAALEVDCLTHLQLDSDLVGKDPMALPEIEQMTEDARSHLEKLLKNVFIPSQKGPRFFNCGEEEICLNVRDFRHYLSEIMLSNFPKTPIFHNEMIVRKKASGTIVNSRKKLLLGILERSGQENLGIKGYFPDYSMFRTVLLNTGIYQQLKDGTWGYVSPAELPPVQNNGLKQIWKLFETFFNEPSDSPKDPGVLFETLRLPPYGVRDALLPILFAAGYKTFPRAISIRHKGEYLEDLRPISVEDLCKNPSQYRVEVFELDESKTCFLESFYELFKSSEGEDFYEKDLVRKCFEALEAWLGMLPSAWLNTKNLSQINSEIRDVIAKECDPILLFFKELPRVLHVELNDIEATKKCLQRFKEALEGVASDYRMLASASIKSVLSLENVKSQISVVQICSNWAKCFPDDFINYLPDGKASGFIKRMKNEYESDDGLLNSIASHLIGKDLNEWDDSTEFEFAREFKNIVKRVEDFALTSSHEIRSKGSASEGIIKLAEGRVNELIKKLLGIAGEDKTKEILQSALNKLR
jgi:hypothetical protein